MASAQTFPPTGMRPLLTSVQEAPSFVDRKTPPAAAAKTSPAELNVTALASTAVKPLFCSVHESPLSVDRNMPPPSPHDRTGRSKDVADVIDPQPGYVSGW